MLHDPREMLATTGEKLRVSSAVLRRHYVGLDEAAVADGLVQIQVALLGLMRANNQSA